MGSSASVEKSQGSKVNFSVSKMKRGITRKCLRYYGDADGLKVDIVIDLSDGRWAAIVVKLGEDKVPKGHCQP